MACCQHNPKVDTHRVHRAPKELIRCSSLMMVRSMEVRCRISSSVPSCLVGSLGDKIIHVLHPYASEVNRGAIHAKQWHAIVLGRPAGREDLG